MVETIVGRQIPLAMDDCKGAAWFASTLAAGNKGKVCRKGFASMCRRLLIVV